MKELTDLTTPAKVNRKLLEADVQKQCVNWARGRGYWARKFSSVSQRSVPDYLFSIAHTSEYSDELGFWRDNPVKVITFAVEFKAPGKVSTDAQIEEQELMQEAGWRVFVCDSFKVFKGIVDNLEEEVPE